MRCPLATNTRKTYIQRQAETNQTDRIYAMVHMQRTHLVHIPDRSLATYKATAMQSCLMVRH